MADPTMTWEGLMALLSSLSHSELQQPARVFDPNEGVFLKVLGLEEDEDDGGPYLGIES